MCARVRLLARRATAVSGNNGVKGPSVFACPPDNRYPLELTIPTRIMSPSLQSQARTRGPLKYRLFTVGESAATQKQWRKEGRAYDIAVPPWPLFYRQGLQQGSRECRHRQICFCSEVACPCFRAGGEAFFCTTAVTAVERASLDMFVQEGVKYVEFHDVCTVSAVDADRYCTEG